MRWLWCFLLWGPDPSLSLSCSSAPSAGFGGTLHPGARGGGASSPAPVVFTVGSPPSGSTPPQSTRTRMFSGKVWPRKSSTYGGDFRRQTCCVTVLESRDHKVCGISSMYHPAVTATKMLVFMSSCTEKPAYVGWESWAPAQIHEGPTTSQ